MVKYFSFFLFGICLLGLTSCGEDDSCTELPDMTGTIDGNGDSVLAGEIYDFDHVSKNLVASTSIDCNNPQTETAGPSTSRIVVDFIVNSDSTSRVKDQSRAIAAIEAGGTLLEDYEAAFAEIGIYRIIATSDATDVVTERDEDNNDSPPKSAQGSGLISGPYTYSKYLEVEVLPNPDINLDSLKALYGQVRLELKSQKYIPPQ